MNAAAVQATNWNWQRTSEPEPTFWGSEEIGGSTRLPRGAFRQLFCLCSPCLFGNCYTCSCGCCPVTSDQQQLQVDGIRVSVALMEA